MRFNFQTKMFLYFSILMTALISISFALFYVYTSRDLEGRTLDKLTQLTDKTSEQVDSLFMEMDELAIRVLSNPVVLSVLSETKNKEYTGNYFESALDISQKKMLNSLLQTLISLQGPNMSASRISIYNLSNDYFECSIFLQNARERNRYMQTKEFQSTCENVVKNSGYRYIKEPHYDYWTNNHKDILFSLAREIRNLDTYESYGLVEIQQSYDKLNKICSTSDPDTIKVFLISGNGVLAYPHNRQSDKETQQLKDFYADCVSGMTEGTRKVVNPVSKKPELLAFKRSSFSNWTLIMAESEDSILEPIAIFGRIVLLIGGVAVLLVLAIIFFITRKMTLPLRQLNKSLSSVDFHNLSVQISHDNSNNELIRLNQAFDSMFKRVKESMDQIVQYRSQEAKAHVLALQSQMDPHFLYNMLSIISAVSYENGVTKIADISCKLSNILRYITSFDNKDTIIAHEVEHTLNYLELMKVRYEDFFTYTVHVDERALKINVPKLILQPLVENCFQHAFKDTAPPWMIRIEIGCTDATWCMKVHDNGTGFDESKLNQVMAKAEEFLQNPSTNLNEMRLGGLGLANTVIRLRLLYQQEYIFNVEPNSDMGTTITLGGKAV